MNNNLFLLGILWRISKSKVILSFIKTSLDFGLWVFSTVVFMRYLFGSVDNNKTFNEVLIFLIFSVCLWLASNLFMSWYQNRFSLRNDQLLHQALNRMLFDKACNVDLSCYENADFYNTYTIASKEIFTRAQGVLNGVSGLFAAALSSAYVIYVMFTISPIVGAASIIPVTVNILMGRSERKIKHDKYMDSSPYVRRQDYVNRTLYLQSFAKEIRLTGIFGVLMSVYEEATAKIIGVNRKYWKKLALINGVKNIVIFPVFFEGTWLLGAYLAMVAKTISVSDFVVLANSAVSITWMLLAASDSLVYVIDNALYIGNLRGFLDYKERIPEDHDGLKVPSGELILEIRHVSFRYKDTYVLKDVNLKLRSGEMVSLVGHNGSGKSTLIKLIMRLYDPTEGEILLNGTDIKAYNLRMYRDIIGTVFQDFQVFSMSVIENILAGNTNDAEVAHTAMIKSGIADKVNALPKAGDSIMTREFDDAGVVMSGGETQKIAIARAFAKDSDMYLLDEPSSALDPVAEYMVYENFIELCKKGKRKIGILISHRLSSATLADRIYLMENGELTEYGTHRELMNRDGGYAAMYRKQAESYLMEANI